LAIIDPITGGVVSFTVTVELHDPELPEPSSTLQVKLVGPSGNLPDAGPQTRGAEASLPATNQPPRGW